MIKNIDEKIIIILQKQTDYSKEELELDKELEGELGIDSLTFLDISTEIGKFYNIPADSFDIQECSTIRKLIKFVQQNITKEEHEKELATPILEKTKIPTDKGSNRNSKLEENVTSIIARQTDYSKEELELDKELEGELGIDSLTFLDISTEIGKFYNIPADFFNIQECSTIRNLIQAINKNRGIIQKTDNQRLNLEAPKQTIYEKNLKGTEKKEESPTTENITKEQTIHSKSEEKENSAQKHLFEIHERHEEQDEYNFEAIINKLTQTGTGKFDKNKTFLSQGISNTQKKIIIKKILDKYSIPTQIDLFSCDSLNKIESFIKSAQHHSIYKLEDQKNIIQDTSQIDSSDKSLRDFIEYRDSDIFAKTKNFFNFYSKQQSKELLWYGMPSETVCTNRVVIYDEISGKRKEFIMMASNNYLGLATHPKILEAINKAYKKYGTTNTGSRIIAGTCILHKQLEEKLAEFKSTQSCIVFPSGYSANLGTISALVRKNDAVFTDKVNHMSILDGCKLSGGKIKIYKHNDMDDLERILKNCDNSIYGKLIVTDGVFSMHGDICNLPEIVRLAKKYNARVMVDDAHSTGVLGKIGSGTSEHFGLKGKLDLEMGTLSKTFAAVGGFIAGREDVIEYLRFYANSYVFAATIPAGVAAGVIAAIDVIKEEPERKERLWKNINYMVTGLKNLGFDLGNSQSAIIPILIGNDNTALKMGKLIRSRGLYTQTVVFPGVAKGEARLRLSMMSEHTQKDMDTALEILSENGKKLGLI